MGEEWLKVSARVWVAGCLLFGSCVSSQREGLSKRDHGAAYAFDGESLVHPKMVWELMPWMSDQGEQILALSVSGREGSNRYFEPIEKKSLDRGGDFIHYTCRLGEHLRFGYLYHGRSESGIEVLETIESSQGSGTFVSLFLCRLTSEPVPEIVDGSLVRMGERQVLQLIKVIPLGDRWMGRIELDGNRLKVGVDEGRFGNPDDTGFELSLSL